MDDQTWINLQQLVGRGPQPSLLDPQTLDHILYANALAALGGGQPSPGPTPYQLMLADALKPQGGSATLGQGPTTPFADASETYGMGSLATSAPANGGLAPSGDGDGAAAGPGTLYAMGSPANVDQPWQTMADQYAEPPAKPKPPPAPQAAAAPSSLQTAIDPIPGYDETGDNAWRAANDQTFLDAVNRYNTANGYRPGDPGYWTANMLKAQAMQESGGSRHAFETDPLQVNSHRRDWDPIYKPKVTGLTSPEQLMTPQISADAALKWLQYKGWVHDGRGRAVRYRGDDGALQRYNAKDPQYAAKVDGLIDAAGRARRGD